MVSTGLNRARVVAAAAALADRCGLGALTLRALAKDLGIQPPSLYNHIESLEALLRELWLVGNQQLAAAITQATIGRSGDQAVTSLAMAYRAFAKERPGLYGAILAAPSPNDMAAQAAANTSLALVDAALSAYQLSPVDTVHAIRILRATLHGFASLEVAQAFGLPTAVDATFGRVISMVISELRGK